MESWTSEQFVRLEKVIAIWHDFHTLKNVALAKPKIEESINWLYDLMGKNKPAVIYVESPMACQLAVNYLNIYKLQAFHNYCEKFQPHEQLDIESRTLAAMNVQLWDKIGDCSFHDIVIILYGDMDIIWPQVSRMIKKQITSLDWNADSDALAFEVWKEIQVQAGTEVFDKYASWLPKVNFKIPAQVDNQNLTYSPFSSELIPFDVLSIIYYHFYNQDNSLNLEAFNHLESLKLAGVYDMIQLDEYCIISRMPVETHFDNENRLHNANGAAILFNDGYCQYYWHGAAVPKNWIENPDSISKQTIAEELNLERKRCIMEILGENKYALLLDLKAVEVGTYNGSEIVLFKSRKKDDATNSRIYYVKVKCSSTSRQYYICIPRKAFKRGPLGAVAWTFGMKEEDYKLLIET